MMTNVMENSFPNKLVFVNCVDGFVGQNLAKYLSHCAVGASSHAAEEEEDEHENEDQEAPEPSSDEVYKIIGSLKDKNKSKPAFLKDTVLYNSRDILYAELLTCDVIIYDISEFPEQTEEAVWVVSQLHADLEKIDKNKPRTFILISSLLTWARTKPMEGEDPDIPFTEDDFRRRKPHPIYKEQFNAEKAVLKFGKTNRSKLVTYVVATGLTYGVEEGIFHYLFKAGWQNVSELPCIGEGKNILPMIHIQDLAGIIQNLADVRPKSKYIVAVDDSNSSLRQVTKAVSRALTTGKIQFIREDEAALDRDRKNELDQLLMNLSMDAVSIKDMNIHWTAESGLTDNIDRIVKEYKESRQLIPLKVVILGPPASGKSTVAEQICQFYKLHHVRIKFVIEESILKMQRAVASRSERKEDMTEEADEEEEGEEGEGEDEQDYESLLEAINESKERNNGRVEDSYVIQMFREKLRSKPCQNQGFILDGYPKTIEQAKELFAIDEADSDAGANVTGNYNKLLIPDLVICFEATDEFLRQRVLGLPENVIVGTHYTEHGMMRCLTEYRSLNSEGDDTVVTFFEELELPIETMDVAKDTSVKMKDTVQKILKLMGPARNYGLSLEEDEETKSVEIEARIKREAEEKAEKERLEAEESVNRKRRQDEWSRRLEEVKMEEMEQLEVKATPLRNYLMKHIMPTLTQALVECVKVRPEDAIDFIAEYMCTHNPQVD